MISMSSPHSLGVSLTFDHETVQSPKAPHRSFICIEDPSHLHITLPPIKHNPIAHVLEDSYIASTHMWRKLSLFLSFSCMAWSRAFLCFKVARSVTQHHNKSMDYLPWTCTQICPVGTLKHEVWLSSLLYLSCFLVRTTGLLADQAFTSMGLPMRWWLHWKYHFTWSGRCTVSIGVGVVFAFSCFLDFLFTYALCFLICLLSYLLIHFSFTFASAFSLLWRLLVNLFH